MNPEIKNRIAKLLKSNDPQRDINFLVNLQLEQAPWLSKEEAMDCIIFSLVKCYKDYGLSFMWHHEFAQHEQTIQAA